MLSLKRITLVILLLGAITALSGCQPSGDAWGRITENGVLRIGLDPTYPPFEVADENGLYGLDIDLAKAIAGELGLETEFVYFGYDGLYDALATEQVDVLISALVIIPGRTRDFAYSAPYFNAGEILIIPSESEDIAEAADLTGRQLAVELGAQGHVEATQWAKRLSGLVIQPYNSVAEAISAVAGGQADAALVDSVSGRLALSNQPTEERALKRLPQPISVEPYALVVRIEDELLLSKLDETLNSLETKGQLEQIINRWLGE